MMPGSSGLSLWARSAAVWLLGLMFLITASLGWAQQEIPALSARVIDTTSTLRPEQIRSIETRLQAFEQAKGTQIVVLMVPTTAPEEIVDYTQRVGDLWKIGRKDIGDGLLLVIAKNDRTLRIAPAKALEGAVTDLAARQVIERVITPRFREGDFGGGIDAGLTALMALIDGESLPETARTQAFFSNDWSVWLVALFVAVPLMARLLTALVGRKPASLLTGVAAGFLAWALGAALLLSLVAAISAAVWALVAGMPVPTGRRGSSGPIGGWPTRRPGAFNGGLGGFRSGGGGDFGGGGASGRW